MVRKVGFIALAVLALRSPCRAQGVSGDSRNAFYVELLGNGGVYSLNYERQLTDSLGLRVGYATWTPADVFPFGSLDEYQTVPVTVSYLIGRGQRKLELGGGVTFGERTPGNAADGDGSFRTLTAIIGYRSHPRQGYLFRVGLTPFYSFEDGEGAYPDPGFTFSLGVSFGYRF